VRVTTDSARQSDSTFVIPHESRRSGVAGSIIDRASKLFLRIEGEWSNVDGRF